MHFPKNRANLAAAILSVLPGTAVWPCIAHAAGKGTPLLSVTTTVPTGYANQIQNGFRSIDTGSFSGPGAANNILTVPAVNDGYGDVTYINFLGGQLYGSTSDFVQVNGFTPAEEGELYGIIVRSDSVSLSQIVSDINNGDSAVGASSGLVASLPVTDNPFSSVYPTDDATILVTVAPGIGSGNYLGWSFGSDPNTSGVFVIGIAAEPYVPGHAVVEYYAQQTPGQAPPAPSGYGNQITNGTGPNQGVFTGILSDINDLSSYGGGFESNPVFNSVTGIEDSAGSRKGPVTAYLTVGTQFVGLDVLVNGLQATSSQVATLVNIINLGDDYAPPSNFYIASLPSANDSWPSQYNLWLTCTSGTSFGNLAFDFSSSNDPNLAGYTVTAAATVPEPLCVGPLVIGAASLLIRRQRKMNT